MQHPPPARNDVDALSERLNALLPQTQCRKCLFDGCAPYAAAMARGEADINRCPPGGQATIDALALELGRASTALDESHGRHEPLRVALIDEARCIGCRLCIKACPVDAIVGAPRLMHTVITDACTGCELCLPPCPVDCIDMVPPPARTVTEHEHRAAVPPLPQAPDDRAAYWRALHERREARLASGEREQAARLARRSARRETAAPDAPHRPGAPAPAAPEEAPAAGAKARRTSTSPPPPGTAEAEAQRQAVIRAAVARARRRRSARRGTSGGGPDREA